MKQLQQLQSQEEKTCKRFLVAKSVSQEHRIKSNDSRPNNIFMPTYDEYLLQNGPKFTENGDLVQHSIVGKSEWFNKQKLGKRLQFDDLASKQLPFHKGIIRQDTADKGSAPKSEQKSTKFGSSTKLKKNHNNNLTTKNQLIEELNNIMQRIKTNSDVEKGKVEQLEPQLKRVLTKETRVLSKHEETEKYWNYFTERQACLLNRDRISSQLLQAEKYKLKNDTAQVFNVLNTEYERIAVNNWQKTLRKFENSKSKKIKVRGKEMIIEKEQKEDFIVGSDLPRAFSEQSLVGSRLEYIQKPEVKVINDPLAFKSFKSNKYLLQRLDETQDYFQNSYMISPDKRNDFDKLIILGKSQFEIEKEMLLNDGGDSTGVYRKDIDKPPDEYTKEQIYEQQYANKVKLILPQLGKWKSKKLGPLTNQSEKSELSDEWVADDILKI
ncbi:unnamed protein product (macronuclear) [Paramecium tetraurelia]|uniref:Uncharacterized protein n=1 Tax=Paramecium tetraurelia TaxID=5888 RepID=A0BCY9_PARTE|nr:uncharacterized protein GSPATT00004500001 [Paramecium tetraurelia]CAK56406.1 unnamed protein product [Paramecium tetraurelia]|eukprot:XP_001423804.1 hypothetical protein (macronuclear) [Paramecium tetraurelia strain d4-2]